MSITDYQPPVAELLNYGECRDYRKWRNYVRELNLEAKHIPELIKMATDEELNLADSNSKEVWSSLHAWRALGQLKAIEALKPLLNLLNNRDDDWISGDFPTLCTLIGKDSIPLLKEFLADSSLPTEDAISDFTLHQQWSNRAGWKTTLNNLRLIIQPAILFWTILPWLDIFPNRFLLLGFHQLITAMNRFSFYLPDG